MITQILSAIFTIVCYEIGKYLYYVVSYKTIKFENAKFTIRRSDKYTEDRILKAFEK